MHNREQYLLFSLLLSTCALSGCSTATKNPTLPTGSAAYSIIPANTTPPTDYTIRPLDVLSLRVFGEPEVSAETLQVDQVGKIQVPLIGEIIVEGRSAQEVSREITALLANRFLVDPQVSVSIRNFAPNFVSVEGEVKKPGVYEVNKEATLLSAIARAESPLPTAKLNQIIVFRTVNGNRMVARFNLKDIRTGVSADPTLIDGDVVVVGYSSVKGIMLNVLKAAPLFNSFVVLNRELN